MFKKLKGRNTFCFFKSLSKTKGLEIQLTLERNFGEWFEISLKTRKKCDHAGTEFVINLFKFFYFHISIYDFRHWDCDNDRFCIYE